MRLCKWIVAPIYFMCQSLTADYATIEAQAPVHRVLTPTREEMVLNGIWKFRPVNASAWGLIRLPGLWSNTHSWDITNLDGVNFIPKNADWDVTYLQRLDAGLYEKVITVPAS